MMKISPPTYTQTPNDLFDKWLPHLGEVELKVLLVIMRQTFGWHRQVDRISISQLEDKTGSIPKNILKAVKELIKKGLITKKVVGKNGKQMTYYEMVVVGVSNISYPCRSDSATPVESTGLTPVESTVTKERAKKKVKEKEQQQSNPAEPVAASFSKEKKQRTPKAPTAPIPTFSCLEHERCNDLSKQDKSTLMKDCAELEKAEAELSQALDCAYAPTVTIKRNRMALIRTALKEGYLSPKMEAPGMQQAIEYTKRLGKANSRSLNIMAKWNQDHLKEGRMKVVDVIVEGGISAIPISIANALASDWFAYNAILDEYLTQQEKRQKTA